MRDKRKRKQREEVRKILHAMRLELAAQRLVQETSVRYPAMVRIDKLIEVSRIQALLYPGHGYDG